MKGVGNQKRPQVNGRKIPKYNKIDSIDVVQLQH